jgi:hypothetical protein
VKPETALKERTPAPLAGFALRTAPFPASVAEAVKAEAVTSELRTNLRRFIEIILWLRVFRCKLCQELKQFRD